MQTTAIKNQANLKKDTARSGNSKVGNYFRQIIKNLDVYVLALPLLVLLLLFRYGPMYGVLIAFKDYSIGKGVLGSTWVGLKHFKILFADSEFIRVILNTLALSFYKLVVAFPAPIILAILLNELRSMHFKRVVQTVTYIPHFISWVIISGIFIDLLSPTSGIINRMIELMGGEPIFFMADKGWIRSVMVFTHVYKEVGWSAIIYLAAIAGIDQELYQAAKVDGANKLRQIWHITIPGISSTIVVLLVLRLGHLLDAGMEQVLIMYNPSVYEVVDIIDTYVYRKAFMDFQLSLTTAAGLFKSVIACILLVMTNKLSKKISASSLF